MLRDARRRAGLTQAVLAERARTSQPVVSAYERGHREPTVPTLQRLVAATGARLVVLAEPSPSSDLPHPRDDAERADRLREVLLLAEAFPFRSGGNLLAPRMVSTRPR